ncbi:unnamed protein product [Prorocentrum cordatum]|uniref:Uncharacterized protein n=1 Tax=Prorocentrum cordatum TaxID=2364126 RepID=A0ABN9Q5S1_9DINO|nr:unnamed protein product [Polarella glacialis]
MSDEVPSPVRRTRHRHSITIPEPETVVEGGPISEQQVCAETLPDALPPPSAESLERLALPDSKEEKADHDVEMADPDMKQVLKESEGLEEHRKQVAAFDQKQVEVALKASHDLAESKGTLVEDSPPVEDLQQPRAGSSWGERMESLSPDTRRRRLIMVEAGMHNLVDHMHRAATELSAVADATSEAETSPAAAKELNRQAHAQQREQEPQPAAATQQATPPEGVMQQQEAATQAEKECSVGQGDAAAGSRQRTSDEKIRAVLEDNEEAAKAFETPVKQLGSCIQHAAPLLKQFEELRRSAT